MRKVVGGFGKKSFVSTGVRKPGNTCVTDRHDMTLAVKVTLNPNTTNQPTLPNAKILDQSKLKALADETINVNKKLKLVLGRVENILGKAENAGYQHFLLLSKCFQKPPSSGSLKVGIVWQRVKFITSMGSMVLSLSILGACGISYIVLGESVEQDQTTEHAVKSLIFTIQFCTLHQGEHEARFLPLP